MYYKSIFKVLGIFLLFTLFVDLSIFANTNSCKGNYNAETTNSGQWSDPSVWSGNKVPDPNFDKCHLTIRHNIDYFPGDNPWNWSSNNDITIVSGAVLTVYADLYFNPNFNFILEEGGKLIVIGNLYFENNVGGIVDGEIYVSGDLEVDGGNSSGISGDGSIVVDGEITDDNNAIDFSLITSIHRWLIVDQGDWNLNTSWSYKKDGPPAVSPPNHQSVVHIPEGYTCVLDINATIEQLDIKETGAFYIASSKTLTVSDHICNNGELLLKSDMNGTAGLIYNQTEPISASVEKYIGGNNYSYIASPVHDAQTSVFTTTTWGANNPNFYIYDETEPNENWMYGWKLANELNMLPGKGYALYSFENFTPKIIEKELINHDFIVPVTNTFSAGGSRTWNLIGNPFPCHINADSLIEQNIESEVFTGSLYFWENNNDGEFSTADYMVYTLGGGTGNNVSINQGIIAPLTGFFVQADLGGDFIFTQSIKCEAPVVYGKSITDFNKEDLKMIRLSVSSEKGLYNDILLKFNELADKNIDIFDGLKLRGNSHIAFYTLLDDKEFGIQGFPKIEKDLNVELGLDVDEESEFVLKAEQFINFDDDIQLYLEDKSEKRIVNLKEEDYYFTADGKSNNRFILHFDDEFMYSNSSYFSDLNFLSDIKVNTDGDKIFIYNPGSSVTIELIDITGKTVYTRNIPEGNNTIDTDFRRGIYLLRLSSSDINYTKKIYIQ